MVLIRKMTEKDIVSVREIALASWNETYAHILPADIQANWFEKTYSTPMLSKQMEKTHMYVIEDEHEIKGFSCFTKVDEDGDCELTALYISPLHSQQGLGTRLLEHGLQVLQPYGEQLHVYVVSDNNPARLFYEKMGFQLIEEFDEYFEGYPTTTAQYIYPLKTPSLI